MQGRFHVIPGRAEAERAGGPELPPFEEALLAHLDSLFAFALRMVNGDRGRAEDLVQEVSLRAFRNYRTVRAPEKIKSWFFQILVNAHINEYRRQRREPLADVELSEALLESAGGLSASAPQEEFFESLLDGDLQQALDSLPLEFRAVVWLADVEEFSYEAIAQMLGCSMGTVGSRLYRGRSLLRERLQEHARRRGWMKE